jgi:SNF2 family DNA or RNA helicase
MQNEAALSSKAVRLLELCDQAADEDRKVVVYSYFRESIDLVAGMIGDKCAGIITGSTSVEERQNIIDRFADTQGGSVLICQIQAGGIGLNIQTASIVIFLEPQIKPSLESQAVSRVYRMGQVRNVLVYHLLCEDTIDEAMVTRLAEKQEVFDLYADESAMADAWDNLIDREWIGNFIENERRKYLPMVI